MSRKNDPSKDEPNRDLTEANQCIAIGAGVGALGVTVGAIVGATCPLCYIVAPGIVGLGLFQRIRAKLKIKRSASLHKR